MANPITITSKLILLSNLALVFNQFTPCVADSCGGLEKTLQDERLPMDFRKASWEQFGSSCYLPNANRGRSKA